MNNANKNRQFPQAGLTLIELMVALAIGSFLMIGAVQIYNQSHQAFVINDSIARVQETAQFAMDTIESDLRMASNWGRTSRGLAIEGRSIAGDPNPTNLLNIPVTCGNDWVLNLGLATDGNDNAYGLACAAHNGASANSDVITVRRASVNAEPLEAGRLQIQTTRIQGQVFDDGAVPSTFSPVDSETHNLFVDSYYVDANSDLIPGVPTLRRKRLTISGGAPAIIDEEIAPGVENLQVQYGIDVNDDNTVDRYVNPGDPVYNPQAVGYVPGARVITARVWLVVRGLTREGGIQDNNDYQPGNVNLGKPNDEFRRMQVSKTILLRNART